YGVDRNPVAVDLAKVSLWLATLAKDHALTFVDHALRHGDSLVGLMNRQIVGFNWTPNPPPQLGTEADRVRKHLVRVSALRKQIREAAEGTSDDELRQLWSEAQGELATVRLFGDLVIAAFFERGKPKERETKRAAYAQAVADGAAERF